MQVPWMATSPARPLAGASYTPSPAQPSSTQQAGGGVVIAAVCTIPLFSAAIWPSASASTLCARLDDFPCYLPATDEVLKPRDRGVVVCREGGRGEGESSKQKI